MKKKDIIFPVFLQCSLVAKDPYWVKIFEYLSYGITPKSQSKLYFADNVLINRSHSDPQTNFEYNINNKKNIVDLYADVYKLLVDKAMVKPINELCKQVGKCDNVKPVSWSGIKKKSKKDCTLEIFVLNMSREYDLTMKQSIDLLTKIHLGIMFKNFTSDSFVLEDDNLIYINGITFEPNQFYIDLDIYDHLDIDLKSEYGIPKQKLYMVDAWNVVYKEIIKEKNRFLEMFFCRN